MNIFNLFKSRKDNVQTLFKSKGKTPAGDPFFSVKMARGYYVYGERGGKDSIAFVLYNRNTNMFCLINESKPPLDETLGAKARMTTAFGGSIDCDMFYNEICQTEVLEEAGYDVSLKNIHLLGSTLVSTQMSQLCYLYLVDVTDIKKSAHAEHENLTGEHSGNSIHWMTEEDVMDNSDWKSIFIVQKAKHLNFI